MKTTRFGFSLPVTILRENKSFIAYSPALDISTAGDSFDEAKQRFEELVEIFFEEIIDKGTMNDVLTDLGWEKKAHNFLPPTVVSQMQETFSVSAAIN